MASEGMSQVRASYKPRGRKLTSRLARALAALSGALFVSAIMATAASAAVSVSLATSHTDPTTADSVTYTATASGAGCQGPPAQYTYAFEVDGNLAQPNGNSNTYTTTWSSTGSHTVTVNVTDNHSPQCPGDQYATANMNVNVFSPLAAQAISQQPSGAVTQGDTVSLTETPAGGDGTYTYGWSFSSASGPFTDATGATIQRRFLNSGDQTTYVQVTDGANPAHTSVQSITTHVNPAPPLGGDIAQSPTGTVTPGSTVTFTAPESGGVSPYTVGWSFGCKAAPGHYTDASGQTITRNFSQQGTYGTCAEITDAAGNSYRIAIFTTIGSPAPPQACAGGQKPPTIQISSIAEATGCLTQVGSNYVSTSTVTINGVPLTPLAGGSITITPGTASKPGGSVSVGSVSLALGTQVLLQAPLTVDLPDPKTATSLSDGGQEATFFTESAKSISLFGLKIGGNFTWSLGKDTKGYFSAFTLTVNLPGIFKSADGTSDLTGTGSLRVDQDETIEYNGSQFEATGAEIGGVGVKDVCFSLIPANSGDVSSCPVPSLGTSATGDAKYVDCAASTASGDRWDATAEIELPTPTKADIAVFGGGTGESLTDLGGFGTNLNVPIAEDVFLRTVGAGFCFTSPITIRGDVGVGMFPVPDKGDTVDINGTLIYTDATSTQPWSLYLGGTVQVFGNQIGSGNVTVYGNGDFDFDANLTLQPVSFLSLDGEVSGWVQPAYKLFNIEGKVNVCIKIAGQNACAAADGVASSTGAAGCLSILGISVGAGAIWNGPVNLMASSCSVGAYEASKHAAVDAAAGSASLTVAPGTRGLVVGVTGTKAPPGLLITGPGGMHITSGAGVGLQRGSNYLIMRDPQSLRTNILLAKPAAGTYTFKLLPGGGNAIRSIQTAPVLASFSGHGAVSKLHRGKRTVSVSYVLPTGATLDLVERGKHVQQIIARNVRGHACPGKSTAVVGGRALCASVSFTPDVGAGGRRAIQAVVTRGGLPVTSTAVAQYTAPALARPAKPAKLQLLRSGRTITITWSAATGAASYGVTVRLGDGRTLSYLPAAKCRGVKISGVEPTSSVKATVTGIRFDRVRGSAATASLKSGQSRGGSKGKLGGQVCRS